MMKKRLLTGTLVAVMALTSMTTGLSFADETTSVDNTENKTGIMRIMKGNKSGEKVGERLQVSKEERDAEMQAVIDEHYPEISDTWNDLKDDIQSAQDEIRELVNPEGTEGVRVKRSENGERPEKGQRMGLFTDGERPDFENMTDEEKEALKAELFEKVQEKANSGDFQGKVARVAKGQFGLAGERPDFENMTDDEIEAFKAEAQVKREEMKEEREAFKTAIEEGDTEVIKTHLDKMIENMEERLSNVEAKLAELQEDAE